MKIPQMKREMLGLYGTFSLPDVGRMPSAAKREHKREHNVAFTPTVTLTPTPITIARNRDLKIRPNTASPRRDIITEVVATKIVAKKVP
jgi:hypothetical protein